MFLREIKQPVTHLKGVGAKAAALLDRMGVRSVGELIACAPRDYEDRSSMRPLAAHAQGRVYTLATVTGHDWFGYGRARTLKILVEDGSAEAALVCFNRPFLERSLPVGARILLAGDFSFRYGGIQSSSFEAEPAPPEGEEPRTGLIPIYGLTEGLSQGLMRKVVERGLAEYCRAVEDELPGSLIASKGLLRKAEALRLLHAPKDAAELSQARRSLAFEELFWFQLMVARRQAARAEQKVERPPAHGGLRRLLVERLPFSLTPDQERSVAEIALDMARPRPMARLLQGDVGSGKTLVSLMAALCAIESGRQAALMAPTELLARQHADNAARLLEPLGVRIAFLTGDVEDSGRRPLLESLRAGRIDLIVGTQALFSADVAYRDLGLVIVDEQQRFGVLQRTALSRKGQTPDLLMATATPIPRTLALTVFGDLSVSTIRTMPPGRLPVVTHLARQANEAKVYDFVRKEMAAGGRAYFVYPLLGASEKLELKNAEAMFGRLKDEVFPGVPSALAHARMPEEGKRAALAAFARGEASYLVATSVVEVGVDVPEATCMVIEHAERFGLAALHQLRGRVGRGKRQSYCFLVYSEDLTEEGKARMKAMLGTNDGFAIAEEDLRIRGPGEVAGTAQSGQFRLGFADPVRDIALLEEARAEAFAIAAADPGLLSPGNAALRAVLERAPPFPDAGKA